MLNNYPFGLSENSYGAPWNDEEFEFTLEVTIGGSLEGPLSQEEYDAQVATIAEEAKKQINTIDNVIHIRQVWRDL